MGLLSSSLKMFDFLKDPESKEKKKKKKLSASKNQSANDANTP